MHCCLRLLWDIACDNFDMAKQYQVDTAGEQIRQLFKYFEHKKVRSASSSQREPSPKLSVWNLLEGMRRHLSASPWRPGPKLQCQRMCYFTRRLDRHQHFEQGVRPLVRQFDLIRSSSLSFCWFRPYLKWWSHTVFAFKTLLQWVNPKLSPDNHGNLHQRKP